MSFFRFWFAFEHSPAVLQCPPCVNVQEFQALSSAYHVLNDEKKREVYDRTGDVDDDAFGLNKDPNQDWYVES